MNDRARSMLGVEGDSSVGCACSATLNSSSCLHACPLNEILAGRPENGEVDLLYRGSAGDQVLHARTRMIVVRNPDGAAIAGIELFQDVSENHAMQRELSRQRSVSGIVGQSAPMQALYELVEQIASYEMPVLVSGERGTGRERFADAVVELSPRRSAPYIKVNCAALNPALVESELFGHQAGTSSGAPNDRRGCFEAADGGTVLLNEVGELPPRLQARLLQVLEDGQVERVGGSESRPVDVRVIGLCGSDIAARVAAGRFCEHLLARLSGVELAVPALSDRHEDIAELSEHFLRAFSREAKDRGRPKDVGGLTDGALRLLMGLPWPGNVAELENVLRLAWIRVRPGGRITPELLVAPGAAAASQRQSPLNLAALEEQAIQSAMDRSEGNMAAAARLLGIDRSTLWRKLKKAGSI